MNWATVRTPHGICTRVPCGVDTFLTRRAGRQRIKGAYEHPTGVLRRMVLHKTLGRNGKTVQVYLIAGAWDSRHMKVAINRLMETASGLHGEAVTLPNGIVLNGGGKAHLLAFVGHKGLMEFDPEDPPAARADVSPMRSVVLACASRPYFEKTLNQSAAPPLLLTTGLMAPEAPSLDAILQTWLSGGDPKAVHEAAAQAYHRGQKCGIRGARNLFHHGQ